MQIEDSGKRHVLPKKGFHEMKNFRIFSAIEKIEKRFLGEKKQTPFQLSDVEREFTI